jgi:signal transduction histidine kinase
MEAAEPQVSDPALNRRDRLLIFVLTFACCAMAASSWWYYVTEAHANEAAAARTIFAVSEGKVGQIRNWRRERIGDGEVILSDSTISRASRVLTGGSHAERERDLLREVLQRLSRAFLYSDAALVDREGNLRLHLNDSGADDAQFTRERRAELAHEANASNEVVLSDITTRTRSGRPLMSLTVPVRGQGAIILEIDPARFLYPLIAGWPGGGRSAENLLVRVENNEVVDLGPRRFAPGAKPLNSRPLNVRLPSEAELDAGWNTKGRDYRSVLVLATIRSIPDSPWYLVSKIDDAEVAAPLRRLAWAAALLTGLIALVNAAGGVLIVRGTRQRRHREREALFYSIANETPAYLWIESSANQANQGCFLNQPLREFLRSGPSDDPDSWLDRLHPEDRDRVAAAHSRARSLSRGYTTEARIRALGGEYRTVVIDALPQFSGGRFSGFAGALSDVTDRRHAEEQLRLANVDLQSELADRIRREEEIRNLGARLIEAREEERKRLARELHDGLNQQIAAVSIAIGNLKRGIGPEQVQARDEADRIHQRLIEVSESVRAISRELHPALLSFRGLGGAVQSVCDEFASANPLVEVSANISGSFEDVPPPVGLCVYRVLQEALRNVAKHSHADRVRVEMTRSCRTLELTVSDSGAGFEASAAAPRTGLGLISIEERVRLVGGAFTIASTPGHGATLTATISLEEPSAG